MFFGVNDNFLFDLTFISAMIKLIIFDWDDVFTLGSKEGYFKCYHETLVEVGVHLTPEKEEKRIMAKWSKPHREELRELLKEKPNLLDKACKIYEEHLFGDTFVDHLKSVPGSRGLLKELSKKYILSVATGLNPDILRNKVVPKFGFPNVFTQIISSYDIDDVEKQKPHPHMVEKILETQRVKPEEAILVGDAKGDVQMARDAGVTPVVVLTGHLTRKQAEELNVRYIIENVTDLPSILNNIN